jgi:flavodoxin
VARFVSTAEKRKEREVKIGIIVYSMTGHTLAVATKLQEALSTTGHDVHLEPLRAAGPASLGAADAPLETVPEIDLYDALVFATPVRGGTPAPPMVSYLEQITSLEGKRVGCLVTGIFPAGWGRNQTLAQMAETCASKGATICGSGSVGWWSLGRRRQIAEVVDNLAGCLKQLSRVPE